MDYITLSNGIKMPQLGYGVYQVTKRRRRVRFGCAGSGLPFH